MANELTNKQKRFCEEYIIDWNATRAYQSAYKCTYETANASGTRLLVNVSIQTYISEIQNDLAKQSGLSALRVLNELSKMAFSNISDMFESWDKMANFDELTDDQKAAISEINYKKNKVGDADIDTEFVKIKMHDKKAALVEINKMLGFNSPEKSEQEINLKQDTNINYNHFNNDD